MSSQNHFNSRIGRYDRSAISYMTSSQEETRRLEPRLMKLLCVLAHRQGEVLTREQLDDLLWPDSIVNENSLTRAISELRRKLSPSSASASVFIETIPKKGYRLAVPIELSPELASPKNNSHGIRGKACLHPVISYESAEKRTSAYATLLMAAVLTVMVTALRRQAPRSCHVTVNHSLTNSSGLRPECPLAES